jgi:hypothetical protein
MPKLKCGENKIRLISTGGGTAYRFEDAKNAAITDALRRTFEVALDYGGSECPPGCQHVGAIKITPLAWDKPIDHTDHSPDPPPPPGEHTVSITLHFEAVIECTPFEI